MLAKFKDILVLLLKSGTLTLIQNYYPIYTPYFSYDIYFNNVFEMTEDDEEGKGKGEGNKEEENERNTKRNDKKEEIYIFLLV